MYEFSWNFIVALCLVGTAGLFPAFADETPPSTTAPDVMTIIDKMQAVFEPATPRVAAVTTTFTGGKPESVMGRTSGSHSDGR